MGRKLNLSHLTEEECEQILKVIQKDFDIRQVEKERLASIEAKVQEEDARIKILATKQDFNEKYCLICFKKFLFFFTPKTRCSFCKHYLCKNCILFDIQLKAEICLVCHKYHEFLQQSNSWFYKKIGTKFKRFGSAKIVRSLYKRKTDSDAESDSGYHPSIRENVSLSESMAKRSRPNLSKVFESDEIKDGEAREEDEPVRTLSHYRHKLEAVERQIRKQFIETKGDRHTGQSSGSYDELMKQQAFNIALLLSAMTNELTSHLNETADKNEQSKFHENDVGENATKEAISKCVLEQCISHIYESSLPADADDDDHPFGIDPDDQTLRSYIERLSAAIVTKINVDLQSSEEKVFQEEEDEVRKELLKLSNRARMSQIGKHLSDSELEDLQVTTDSLSDIDGREWQSRSLTDTLSARSSLRRPVNQRDFDDSEYDVDENSIFAFASRKKGLVTLPGLDTSSPSKSADVDLELTTHAGSSSEDPWTLSERGPVAMMSNRIPIAPYDDYGKKKCGPAEAEGDLKIFFPKRHSIDGPLIDSMSVYELPDFSDGSLGSPFDESHLDLDVTMTKQPPLNQSKRSRSPVEEHREVLADKMPEEDMEVQADITPLKHLEVPASGTQEQPAEASSDSDLECSREPRFVTLPQDVAVNCGEAFTCCCKLSGAKPIDMFWYRDADELIQLGSDERFTLSHKGSIYEIHLSNCQLSDAGLYICIAVNQHGSCQHRFAVTVQDEKTYEQNPLGLYTTDTVSYENDSYEIGLTPTKTNGLKSDERNNSTDAESYENDNYEIGLTTTKTNGLKSDETNNSERLLEHDKRFEQDDEKDSDNLASDASSSATWRKELTTGIQSHGQESKQSRVITEHLMGSQDFDNRSASAERLPVSDVESSDNSSIAHEDKIAASAIALDVSSKANDNKVIEVDWSTEDGKEATATEEERKEFLDLRISEKKSMDDDIEAIFARSDDEATVDDSTKLLLYEDYPYETDNRTTSLKDSEVTGVRSMAESDRNENSSFSYGDFKKSNEGIGKTVVSDSITENDNRVTTMENEEHQLYHGGSKRSNEDDITTSSGTVLNRTIDDDDDDDDTVREVEDSIREHHLSYRNPDNKEKIRSFYEEFTDGSMTNKEESPIKDEINQYPTYREHRTSDESETGTDTETMNESKASEEKADTKAHSISAGFHEDSSKNEKLSSARSIPSHLTSADSDIKEIAGNSDSEWKAKTSYADEGSSRGDQSSQNVDYSPQNVDYSPQNVDYSPQNVDYRRYSREYDISNRRALFEQKDKSVITESRNSALTSADNDIKEIAGNPDSEWKAKTSYTDESSTRGDQSSQNVDYSPQNVDYRRYSREYDISNRRALFEQKDKSAIAESRNSASPVYLARRSPSSSSESDVFTPQASSFANATSVNLSSATRMTQTSKKNELDEITLPSVKLLRLKFSAPPDTSSADASLQWKRHSQTKMEAEPRWKSAEYTEKQVTSPHFPVSVVPLQRAPINSRSSSRPPSRTDITDVSSHLKSEPKFQQEVIIRPNVIRYSKTNSEEQRQPEPDGYLPQSVADRVVIRPFYQRGDQSTTNEAEKRESSYQNR